MDALLSMIHAQIYARVFDLLVTKCNEATEPKGSTEYGTISLLDIFGFESFKVNRFEQLCKFWYGIFSASVSPWQLMTHFVSRHLLTHT